MLYLLSFARNVGKVGIMFHIKTQIEKAINGIFYLISHPGVAIYNLALNVMKITSSKKGQIAEHFVRIDLMKKGFDIYKPIVEDNQIDIIAHRDTEFYKIQVKGRWIQPGKTSVYFDLRKHVQDKLIDYYAFYIGGHDIVCYDKFFGQRNMTIAVKNSKNNQQKLRKDWKNFRSIPLI